MQRSRRIVILAHCLLNANSRVEGIAAWQGTHPIVGRIAERGYGMIQLPCPELPSGGCRRWAATIEQYDTPTYRAQCDELAESLALQVGEYVRCGYTVGPVIGVEGSPSCAVFRTTSGTFGGRPNAEEYAAMLESKHRVEGSGVFMRALAAKLQGFGIAFLGLDGCDEETVERTMAALEDQVL